MTIENIKMFFYEGINYLESQIKLLNATNQNLKNQTYMQYIEKNTPLIVSEIIENAIYNEKTVNKVIEMSNVFSSLKEYMQNEAKKLLDSKICNISEIEDVFYDYTNMLSNNLESLDLHETFWGWTEDGSIYNTRANENVISSHTAGIETLLVNHFEKQLDIFTWKLAGLLNDLLELTEESKCMANNEIGGISKMKNELNKELIKELIEKEFGKGEQVTFIYSPSNSNAWSITIRKEEEKYLPFNYSIEGKKIDTNETWSRRYVGIKDALLHIVNDFNENANIKDKYNDIEEYINEENPRRFDYMMLDRLRSDCEYFLGNGNGYLGNLYYKDVNKHIDEMKKLYESFPDKEKPEWINLEELEKYKEKMNNKLKEYNFKKQDYKYIIKCDLSSNDAKYLDQYLLVEDDKIPSDLDVDLIGDCCFNCDYEVQESKIVAKVYSLDDVKKFCELNKINIEKNIDKEGDLIIGASKDMIIARDMNRYDREREIELNNDEIGGNND